VLQRDPTGGGKGGQGYWCTDLMSQRVVRRYFGHVLREHVGPGISAVRMPAAISKLGDE